ncbi:MAG: ABC transporter ATP-binding protein [Angelakisella sp.]|nr:ABC transporter ATP-binding protein [Angelakisella sp.]
MEKLLEVKNLSISFHTYNGEVQAVRDASFDLNRKEVLAIVGESGSGKSVMMQTILKLTPGVLGSGQILFDGNDITHYSDKQMQTIRGSQIGIIFQDAMTSLNPTMKIGRQITESILRHQNATHAQAKERALELLRQVGINNPEKRYHQYIHNLSGGMRQRVMIAIALACQPKLLIADEPTTALDVTIQAQIMALLAQLKNEMDCSIVLITHDLGVVAANADRVAVMYAGRIVEVGTSDEIFYYAQHPYTRGLLDSIPRLNASSEAELTYIEGSPPDALNPAPGCSFCARCKYAMRICTQQRPSQKEVGDGHLCACFLLDEEAAEIRQKLNWEVTV